MSTNNEKSADETNIKAGAVLYNRYIVDKRIGEKGQEGWIFLVNDTTNDKLEQYEEKLSI